MGGVVLRERQQALLHQLVGMRERCMLPAGWVGAPADKLLFNILCPAVGVSWQVWAHVGGPKTWGDGALLHWDRDRA